MASLGKRRGSLFTPLSHQLRISKEYDEGLIIHGTRQWDNYRVQSDITLHSGEYGGLAFRVQGMRRYYAARILRDGKLQIVRVRDTSTKVLAEAALSDVYERPVSFDIAINGQIIPRPSTVKRCTWRTLNTKP